jgi:hypothetical protein
MRKAGTEEPVVPQTSKGHDSGDALASLWRRPESWQRTPAYSMVKKYVTLTLKPVLEMPPPNSSTYSPAGKGGI